MALTVTNPSDRHGATRVADLGPVPDDPGSNYSYVLGYTGALVTTIDKTIDGITWRKTLTWTGNDLTGISAWVQQ